MSTQEKDQTSGDEQHDADDESNESSGHEQDASDGEAQKTSGDKQDTSETPELSDEGKEKVQQMRQAYDDERPTVALPGTDNTITGVAVNEWLDDDGNPKFGQDEQQEKQQNNDEQRADEQQQDAG